MLARDGPSPSPPFLAAQVACLQCVPQITITNGIPTTFIPLGIVLGFDGVVTALEDYKRHVNDARANSSTSAFAGDCGRREMKARGARTCVWPCLTHFPPRALLPPRHPQRWSCAKAGSRRWRGATFAWAT